MNITFNWGRFLLLCKREFTEGRMQWLRWYGLLAVILFVFAFSGESKFVGIAFLMVVCVASASLMPGISDRQKRIFYLMIPASPLEKLLSRYVYVISVIFVAFPVALLTAEVAQQIVVHFLYDLPFEWSLTSFSLFGDEIETGILSFFTLQVVFMLGSMVWLKNPFFKTVLFHTVFGVVMVVGILIIVSMLSHSFSGGIRQFGLGLHDSDWPGIFFKIIHILMLVFFYVLCYFRFRELGIMHKLLPPTPTLRIVLACYAFLLLMVFAVVALGITSAFGEVSGSILVNP